MYPRAFAGSINRVVRYISHPAVRSACIPTLYLRGMPSSNGEEDTRRPCNLRRRISTLPEAVRVPRSAKDIPSVLEVTGPYPLWKDTGVAGKFSDKNLPDTVLQFDTVGTGLL